MFIVDLILGPTDNFWRKKCHQEEIRANRAEANEKYATQIMEQQEKDLDLLTRRDVGQARAIEAMNKEITRLKEELAKAEETMAAKDENIRLLSEALKSERDAKAALKTAQRLWDEKRQAVTGRAEE